MKSIISGAVIATAIVASLTLNLQAKPVNSASSARNIAVSDTDKMAGDKMKMDKMEKKKMSKMKKDKMKMDKEKMSKDTKEKM
jgi:uncharacterized protein involved in copper resistance